MITERIATRFLIRAHIQRVLVAFGVTDLEKLNKEGRKYAVLSGYRAESHKHENQKRHGDLVADLQRMGYHKFTPMKSSWKDMATDVTHGEKSVLVPNMSFDDAIKLGKKYNQDAILYKDPSGTIGVYFKDGTAIMAYEPKGDLAVSVSKGKEEYSKGRGLSFGLKLVEDKKFNWKGGPITSTELAKELPKSEKGEGKGEGSKKDEGSKDKKDRATFLEEMGDKTVKNPNPDGNKDRVKIKSLDPDDQKRYYEEWAIAASMTQRVVARLGV